MNAFRRCVGFGCASAESAVAASVCYVVNLCAVIDEQKSVWKRSNTSAPTEQLRPLSASNSLGRTVSAHSSSLALALCARLGSFGGAIGTREITGYVCHQSARPVGCDEFASNSNGNHLFLFIGGSPGHRGRREGNLPAKGIVFRAETMNAFPAEAEMTAHRRAASQQRRCQMCSARCRGGGRQSAEAARGNELETSFRASLYVNSSHSFRRFAPRRARGHQNRALCAPPAPNNKMRRIQTALDCERRWIRASRAARRRGRRQEAGALRMRRQKGNRCSAKRTKAFQSAFLESRLILSPTLFRPQPPRLLELGLGNSLHTLINILFSPCA